MAYLGDITAGQQQMQNVIRAAAATARAQNAMDPVKLIASDGSEIIIDRKAALVSGTIKSMIQGPGRESIPMASSLPWLHASSRRRKSSSRSHQVPILGSCVR